jgi:uncharacterized protein (TIGR01244 family)
MNPTQIAENYFVSAQIAVADVSTAKAEGYQAIVCNRPDDEEPGQVNHDLIKAACEEQGLSFYYLPMQGPNFTPDYVEQVKTLISDNQKVLGYCRSGNRSTILYNAAL